MVTPWPRLVDTLATFCPILGPDFSPKDSLYVPLTQYFLRIYFDLVIVPIYFGTVKSHFIQFSEKIKFFYYIENLVVTIHKLRKCTDGKQNIYCDFDFESYLIKSNI